MHIEEEVSRMVVLHMDPVYMQRLLLLACLVIISLAEQRCERQRGLLRCTCIRSICSGRVAVCHGLIIWRSTMVRGRDDGFIEI